MNHFKKTGIALLVFVAITTINAQQKLPITDFEAIDRITNITCNDLQENLKIELLKNKKWARLINDKKMAIGIVDLHDVEHPRFAGVNEQHMMYAASLPKIAILYAAMDAINTGDIIVTDAIDNDMKIMISKSNNAAATRMIDLVGFDRIANILKNVEPKLYDESIGGGLWVGKRYGAGGERNPDPMKGLSHAATTLQVCNFYYQLVYGKLINEQSSEKMLAILKDPKLSHKFVNTLQFIAPDASIYRKSGSWKSYHSDSVLVWGPNRKYILVALIDDLDGEMIIRNLVKPIENVIQKTLELNCNN